MLLIPLRSECKQCAHEMINRIAFHRNDHWNVHNKRFAIEKSSLSLADILCLTIKHVCLHIGSICVLICVRVSEVFVKCYILTSNRCGIVLASQESSIQRKQCQKARILWEECNEFRWKSNKKTPAKAARKQKQNYETNKNAKCAKQKQHLLRRKINRMMRHSFVSTEKSWKWLGQSAALNDAEQKMKLEEEHNVRKWLGMRARARHTHRANDADRMGKGNLSRCLQ